MRSYPFIQDLFTNVLEKSKAVRGRFTICPKYGLEINSDELGKVLENDVKPIHGNKYPCVLMMPPRSRGNFNDNRGEWESYRIVMFFLATSFYNGANQVKFKNPSTQTSAHTVPQDWHDMKRCAANFLRVLDMLQRKVLINEFRIQQTEKIMDPVSFIGVDRASGIRLDFNVSVFVGCDIEDYNEEDISSITLPEADSHPEHNQ